MKTNFVSVSDLKPGSWIRVGVAPVEVTEIEPLGSDCYRVHYAGVRPWDRWVSVWQGSQLCEVVAAAVEAVAA